MASILHITRQLNTERTFLDPAAVFHKIERGERVPLGKPGDQKWAVPHAITVVEEVDELVEHRRQHRRADVRRLTEADSRSPNSPARFVARLGLYP